MVDEVSAKWVSIELIDMKSHIKGLKISELNEKIVELQEEDGGLVKPEIVRFELGKVKDVSEFKTDASSYKDVSLEIKSITISKEDIKMEFNQELGDPEDPKIDTYFVVYPMQNILKYTYSEVSYSEDVVTAFVA
jgi:hypothetical protein